MFYVVSYDISDDKKRTKVSKILCEFGPRVQYSVFECVLTGKQVKELKQKLSQVIDVTTDSVIFYPLCNNCVQKRDIIGIVYVEKTERVSFIGD